MQKNSLKNLLAKEFKKADIKNARDLDSFKRRLSKFRKTPPISNVKLLKEYHDLAKISKSKNSPFGGSPAGRQRAKLLETLLIKRKVRSLSGVAVISILTKPYPCPGKCLYCPSQKGMPKSYLSNEPAVMRAVLNNFDPYKQVQSRIKSLEDQGHPTDKIELIVIGGTWSYLPKNYQEQFIKKCFEACNSRKSKTLESAQKTNEKTKHRVIGITIETRPDFITEKEVKRLRILGVTRVEMGVQSIFDKVLRKNLRGHSVAETIRATKLLKDAGFKICYHLMPNLPGSNLAWDKKMFEEIFKNPDFQPDLLKIYPCAILKEAPIYKLWQHKKYKPYTEKELIGLLKNAKKKIPYYCRIQRLVRDIPAQSIVSGPAKISNLRQVLAKISEKEGWRCKCIRCREVKGNYAPKEKLFLFRQDYFSSGGKEIFLSYENKDRTRLYSLLRLRLPGKDSQPIFPALADSAIIRELHTYGQLQPLQGPSLQISPQHKGLGKKLIFKAERITKKEFGLKRIAVISGVGVRDYYKNLGYKLEDSYMIKNLD